MNQLVEGFIKEQMQKELFQKEGLSNKFDSDFTDYMFKVYLYGYVKKTIIFSSLQIKKKTSLVKKNEELSLNVVDPDFHEERLNLISYSKEDLFDEIFELMDDAPKYNEISYNEDIIRGIDTLTDRQKEIIYRCIIKGDSDTLVAKRLGVTKQSVNKIKKTALNKLRIFLREEKGVI